jgi:hypothetical protein
MSDEINQKFELNRELIEHFEKPEFDADKREEHQLFTLKDFEQRCVLCDSTKALILHHKRYPARCKEDFVVLCLRCHAKFHIGGGKFLKHSIQGLVISAANDDVDVGVLFNERRVMCDLCMEQKKVSLFESEYSFKLHLVADHSKELSEKIASNGGYRY